MNHWKVFSVVPLCIWQHFLFPFCITFTSGCTDSINLDNTATLTESNDKKFSCCKYHQTEMCNIEVGLLDYELGEFSSWKLSLPGRTQSVAQPSITVCSPLPLLSTTFPQCHYSECSHPHLCSEGHMYSIQFLSFDL